MRSMFAPCRTSYAVLCVILSVALPFAGTQEARAQSAASQSQDPQSAPSTVSHSQNGAKILAIGDSLMAWHLVSKRSIADVASKLLDEPIQNRAVAGAKIVHILPVTGALGMKISKQFRDRSWEWVIMNGGGNDLFLGCGCNKCDRRMARMISPQGTQGDIPNLVAKIRSTGARVAYIGYLRSPGIDSVIDECRAHGDELETRLAQMAARDDGVHFISLADLVPHGDRSMHGIDMIHPSRKASAAIGALVAQTIQAADKAR